MADLLWLDSYSGETVEDLLALESRYRTDSLVLIFEQAIDQKAAREGLESLSREERIVLAVKALEREVNNGGYEQFFLNSTRQFAPVIVEGLLSIKCPRTAAITQKALDAFECLPPDPEAIERNMLEENEDRDQVFFVCDNQYFTRPEDIEGSLIAFIRTNKGKIRL